MTKAYILYGVSGSGKSTQAEIILESLRQKSSIATYINRDNTRKEVLDMKQDQNLWNSYKLNKKIEIQVTSVCNQQLMQAILDRKDLVIDNTHLNLKERNHLVKYLKFKNYDIQLVNCTYTDLLYHYIKNNKLRINVLPSSGIINDQFIRQCINKDLPISTFKEAKIALVDIDGTIAYNDGHRNYFDYTKVDRDEPIKHTIEVIKALYETNRVDYIQFLSGRDSSCYDLTLKWLEDQGFDMSVHNLFMRLKNDRRKDTIIKKEILDNCLINKEILYVFDDRNQMVDLWHDLKMPIFNVGDYRNEF